MRERPRALCGGFHHTEGGRGNQGPGGRQLEDSQDKAFLLAKSHKIFITFVPTFKLAMHQYVADHPHGFVASLAKH